MADSARKQKRAIKPAMILAIAALLAVGALFAFSAIPELQHQAIRLERLKRYALWKAGFTLAGTPDFSDLPARLERQGFKHGAPVFIRIFKREFELELWMKRDGRFHLFQAYPICKWSGRLGPKLKQGDHQSPEGFYTVAAGAMNPASRWHRSFNLGFPNPLDRHHGRTGSYLMVHGGCSSVGCYAVTNDAVEEIWRLTTAAHNGGQRRFHVHVFPFRMTATNLAWQGGHRWTEFWHDLKNGHDAFDLTGLPPKVFVCKGRYAVATETDGTSRGAHRIVRRCPPQGQRFVASQQQ